MMDYKYHRPHEALDNLRYYVVNEQDFQPNSQLFF